VVVLCQVIITTTDDKKSYCFIARTESEDKGARGRHAEQVAIDRITKEIMPACSTDSIVKIHIIAMSTKTPCYERCQGVISEMLRGFKGSISVSYKLRIASFYHDTINGKQKSDDEVIADLVSWKHELRKVGVRVEIEPISVCEELPNHQIREVKCDTCKPLEEPQQEAAPPCPGCEKMKKACRDKRQKKDKKIAALVEKTRSRQTTLGECSVLNLIKEAN